MSWTIFFSADKIIAVKIFQIVELVRFSAPAEPGNSLQSDIRSKSPLKLKKNKEFSSRDLCRPESDGLTEC